MAKPALVFVCADCGAETLKWQGQCPQCSQWNTLEQRSVAHATLTIQKEPDRPDLPNLEGPLGANLPTGVPRVS